MHNCICEMELHIPDNACGKLIGRYSELYEKKSKMKSNKLYLNLSIHSYRININTYSFVWQGRRICGQQKEPPSACRLMWLARRTNYYLWRRNSGLLMCSAWLGCGEAVIFLICLAIIGFVIKIGGSGGMTITCCGVNCLQFGFFIV